MSINATAPIIGALEEGEGDDSLNSSYQDHLGNICAESYNNTTMMEPSLTNFIMYGVLLTPVGLLGICGNLISVTILSRPKMRSSINCCLIGLTTFDLIVTTTSILMFGLPAISDYTNTMALYTKEVFPRITPFIFPLALIAQTGSVYLTVTVTVERYIAVCRPLKARSICTYGRAKVYVMCVALFSIMYNLPRFWEVSYEECSLSEDKWLVIVVPSALRMDAYYVQIYIMWMYLFVMYLFPFLSLIVFNYFIYKEVRAANHERQQLSRLQRKEIGLAVMLLVVVSVFFVCNLLAFIVNVLELMDTNTVMDELTITSNFLVTINSSVNFIIYCIFGQKFRRLFLKMFCAGFCGAGIGRELAGQDSGAFGNSVYGESRTLTNGRTQTFRLSSWNGSHQSERGGGGRVLHHPNELPHHGHLHHNHNHHHHQGFSWRTSRYTSVPLGDSADSSSRTSGSLFNSSRSQSLLPQRTPSENVHVL